MSGKIRKLSINRTRMTKRQQRRNDKIQRINPAVLTSIKKEREAKNKRNDQRYNISKSSKTKKHTSLE